MPNMSYCAFENTGRAIEQLIGMMEDAREHGASALASLELSSYEREAMNGLSERFKKAAEMMEELQSEDESEDSCKCERCCERKGIEDYSDRPIFWKGEIA